jgi:hypothetical protein
MGLNGLLGFKVPTHLMPTQTHPFDTPRFFDGCRGFVALSVWGYGVWWWICSCLVGKIEKCFLRRYRKEKNAKPIENVLIKD